MQDIKQTIKEYESSHGRIKLRIQELNVQIAKCHNRHDSILKQLLDRRIGLYAALWDIEYALREMREYLYALAQREVNEKVG